jgi:hypothetical protein
VPVEAGQAVAQQKTDCYPAPEREQARAQEGMPGYSAPETAECFLGRMGHLRKEIEPDSKVKPGPVDLGEQLLRWVVLQNSLAFC